MPPRSPLEYDVSVTADKARRARRRGMSGAVGSGERLCEHPQCDQPGVYRAPRGPGDLQRFRWFCLDHVRDYNARWNFFETCDEAAFETYLAGQRVWERPTWRLGKPPPGAAGAHADGRAWERFGFSDPFEVLGDNATLNPGRTADQPRRRPSLPKNVRSALEILGAAETETRGEIRRRYRALVKDLHPDMNGGDRSEEGRLRRVLWAWGQVRAARAIPD